MAETSRWSWTQPQCAACWDEANPDRRATALLAVQDEICVTCGTPTRAGIYIRIDPDLADWPTIRKDDD